MTYGYNKSIIGLIDVTLNMMFKDTHYIKVSKKLCNNICTLIVKTLINIFNDEFKTLNNLKLIFNSLITIAEILKTEVYIGVNSENGFFQYYRKIEYVTFQKWRAYKDSTSKNTK
jgi:hypothetical protein